MHPTRFILSTIVFTTWCLTPSTRKMPYIQQCRPSTRSYDGILAKFYFSECYWLRRSSMLRNTQRENEVNISHAILTKKTWLSRWFRVIVKRANYDNKNVVSMLRQKCCGVYRCSVEKKLKDSPPYLDRFPIIKQKVVRGPLERQLHIHLFNFVKKVQLGAVFKYAQTSTSVFF